MFIIKALICLIVLIIIPEILGMLITKFMKEKNILLSILIGYIVEFSILQIIAVPLILLRLKYKVLLYSWTSIIAIISIISVILNFKDVKNELIKFFKNLKLKKVFNKSNIIVFIAIILISFQVIFSIVFTHNDGDDAFYIGTSVATLYENKMYIVGPENGYYYGKIPFRYVLAPFPMYVAIISSITHINPVIIAHTAIQPVFIFLTYAIYTLIAEKLFDKNKEDISLFLIFLSIIYMFGNISTRTNFTVMFFRIWQGKAMLANILLPSLWLLFSYCLKENNFINWMVVFLTVLSCCLVSEMGIILAPLSLVLLSVVFGIKNKKISYLLKSIICTIPCVIYLITYLVIK